MAQAILTENVETLGEKGDVVDVSPGYLRNFLVPRKLAQPATAGSVSEAQRRKDAAERAVREAAEKAQDNAALLSKTVLTITHPAGDDVRLRPADFYLPKHTSIFGAMLALADKSEPVDALTVAAELDRQGDLQQVGGQAYIHSLPSSVPSAAHVSKYGQDLRRPAPGAPFRSRRRLVLLGCCRLLALRAIYCFTSSIPKKVPAKQGLRGVYRAKSRSTARARGGTGWNPVTPLGR